MSCYHLAFTRESNSSQQRAPGFQLKRAITEESGTGPRGLWSSGVARSCQRSSVLVRSSGIMITMKTNYNGPPANQCVCYWVVCQDGNEYFIFTGRSWARLLCWLAVCKTWASLLSCGNRMGESYQVGFGANWVMQCLIKLRHFYTTLPVRLSRLNF